MRIVQLRFYPKLIINTTKRVAVVGCVFPLIAVNSILYEYLTVPFFNSAHTHATVIEIFYSIVSRHLRFVEHWIRSEKKSLHSHRRYCVCSVDLVSVTPVISTLVLCMQNMRYLAYAWVHIFTWHPNCNYPLDKRTLPSLATTVISHIYECSLCSSYIIPFID